MQPLQALENPSRILAATTRFEVIRGGLVFWYDVLWKIGDHSWSSMLLAPSCSLSGDLETWVTSYWYCDTYWVRFFSQQMPFHSWDMANILRLLFCVTLAYGALVEEEMNALLDDSCEGECTLSLLQTLCRKYRGCCDGFSCDQEG